MPKNVTESEHKAGDDSNRHLRDRNHHSITPSQLGQCMDSRRTAIAVHSRPEPYSRPTSDRLLVLTVRVSLLLTANR
jgi:hypothetical protein